jgi:CheY-like chemotaxis protein
MTTLQNLGLQNRHAHDLGFINVLVAEDDEAGMMQLQSVLTKWKANVTLAHTYAEAISKAGSTDFDLILTDFQTPDMDSVEATQRIRKISKTAPIISVCGSISLTDSNLKAAGISECLYKPYSTEDLYNVIDHNMPQELRLVG